MLSGPTTYDCSHHSSCIHCQAKPSFVGPCHLPRCWGKKPKTTTKVTLTSHQSTQVMSSKFFLKNTFPSRSVNNPLSHPIGHSVGSPKAITELSMQLPDRGTIRTNCESTSGRHKPKPPEHHLLPTVKHSECLELKWPETFLVNHTLVGTQVVSLIAYVIIFLQITLSACVKRSVDSSRLTFGLETFHSSLVPKGWVY